MKNIKLIIYIAFFILYFSSCSPRFGVYISNQMDRYLSSENPYYKEVPKNEIEKLDSLVKDIINNYDDYILKNNSYEVSKIQWHSDTLVKYLGNSELILCRNDLIREMTSDDKIATYLTGCFIYKIKTSDFKIRVYLDKFNVNSKLHIAFRFAHAKTCKYWKWEDYISGK